MAEKKNIITEVKKEASPSILPLHKFIMFLLMYKALNNAHRISHRNTEIFLFLISFPPFCHSSNMFVIMILNCTIWILKQGICSRLLKTHQNRAITN